MQKLKRAHNIPKIDLQWLKARTYSHHRLTEPLVNREPQSRHFLPRSSSTILDSILNQGDTTYILSVEL
jgi:hypothetical protein